MRMLSTSTAALLQLRIPSYQPLSKARNSFSKIPSCKCDDCQEHRKKHICIKPSTVIQACLYARQGNANFRHNCIHTTAMTLPSVINPCKCAHLYRCSHLLRGQMPHVEPQSSTSCRRPSRENLSSQDQSSSFAGGGPHG